MHKTLLKYRTKKWSCESPGDIEKHFLTESFIAIRDNNLPTFAGERNHHLGPRRIVSKTIKTKSILLKTQRSAGI